MTRAWLDQAFVWGQVNFNAQDPATLDVAWWADYWAACRLQGVTLNVGGPLAYYPTSVPLHPRSPFLGDRDLLGETVEAAKRMGLRVLGRLDPTFTTAEVRHAHPDWCVTGANGAPHTWESFIAAYVGRQLTPVDEESMSYLACSYSPYFDEYVLAITSEVLTAYELDGIWTNGWPFGPATPSTMCHCPHCVGAWERARPGRPRPVCADAGDPDWRDYLDFASSRVEDLQRRFRDHVHRVKPGAAFISSGATRPETTVRWGRMIEHSDALGIDAQGRSELATDPARRPVLWSVGLQSELTRAVAEGKPVIRFVATYVAEEQVVRQGARPPLETRLQMAQALAHGDRPKWHTLGGTAHDRRWMPAVRELDEWMSQHHACLLGSTPVSDVGVVWSPRSIHLQSWGAQPGPSHRDALVGWYLALMESRIPFEYVHEDHLRSLDRFAVLVLPTGLCLSDEAVEAITSFADRAGAVVGCCGALGEDEWGGPRRPDVVRRLLGVEYAESLIGPLKHACIEVDGEGLFDGLGDTDIIGGGRWIRAVELGGATEASFQGAWIPDYPVAPTQDVVLPDSRRDVPLFSTAAGPGGAPAVYLAADLDAAYGRNENPDHGRILTNAVRKALDGRSLSVEVRGAGVVDVRPWRQEGSALVFLVNLDNARMQGGAVRELRPLGPVEVVVRLAPGETAHQVRLLRQDIDCVWHQDGHEVVATVPSVEDFELLVVDVR